MSEAHCGARCCYSSNRAKMAKEFLHQAKELGFADYVRWRLQPDVAPTIRNFHCAWVTSIRDRLIGEPEYAQALTQLVATPAIVIVERYDESMVLLEHELADRLPCLLRLRC